MCRSLSPLFDEVSIIGGGGNLSLCHKIVVGP